MSENKRHSSVLLVNQVFYPDVVATASYLSDLARGLAKDGFDVTALASRRGYAPPHEIYSGREQVDGVSIVRIWPYSFGRRFKLLRMLDALCLNFAFAFRLLFIKRHDVIVALTSPPLVAFIALIVARLRGSEFVHWVMDLNPDEAIAAGWISERGLIARVFERISRFVLSRSNAVVVLDHFMKTRVVNKGTPPERVKVLPPWAQTDLLDTVSHEQNPFRKLHGLEDKFVVMYSGNHSVCHPLDTVLKAAKALRESDDVVFVFIGAGARVKDVSAFRDKHQLENILQLPYVPFEELKNSLSAADLQVVVMGAEFVGIIHPSKIYGLLQIGRPFAYIGPKLSHVGEIIDEFGVGHHVDHGDVDLFIRVVEHVKRQDEHRRGQVLKEAKDAATNTFSKHELERELIGVIGGQHTAPVARSA